MNFNRPVTIRMPVPGGASGSVFMASPGQDWNVKDATLVNGVAEWEVGSFSWAYWSSYFGGTYCFKPASMLNDPYWCLLPKIGAGIITTPPEALTQTYIDPYVYFGRVDQAATLHFQTQVYVPGNCGNVTVELRRRRYNASTVTWGPPQTISTQSPALTVDGSWLSGTATFDFSFTYLDNGRNDFELVLSADCPGVLHNANGDVFAVWSRYDGARNHIYTARHPAATTWDATVRIDSDTGSAGASQIAVNANGDAFAVWYQFDGTRYNIWSNRRLAADTGWGAAELIETDNAGSAYDPQAVVDPNGNALSVWRQNDGTRDNIWANSFK